MFCDDCGKINLENLHLMIYNFLKIDDMLNFIPRKSYIHNKLKIDIKKINNYDDDIKEIIKLKCEFLKIFIYTLYICYQNNIFLNAIWPNFNSTDLYGNDFEKDKQLPEKINKFCYGVNEKYKETYLNAAKIF